MALTVSANVVNEVPGALRMVAGTLTGDASYPTGGYSIAGLVPAVGTGQSVVWLQVTGVRGVAGTVCSHCRYDATNQKVLVYNTTAGAETANATNLSALVMDYVAYVR